MNQALAAARAERETYIRDRRTEYKQLLERLRHVDEQLAAKARSYDDGSLRVEYANVVRRLQQVDAALRNARVALRGEAKQVRKRLRVVERQLRPATHATRILGVLRKSAATAKEITLVLGIQPAVVYNTLTFLRKREMVAVAAYVGRGKSKRVIYRLAG